MKIQISTSVSRGSPKVNALLAKKVSMGKVFRFLTSASLEDLLSDDGELMQFIEGGEDAPSEEEIVTMLYNRLK